MMGPMSGLISIAPMTTAVELTLSPIEQMKMLNTRIQRLNPRNSTSRLIPSMVSLGSATSMILNRSMANGFKSCARRSHKDRG